MVTLHRMIDSSGDSSAVERAVMQSLRGWRAAGVTHLPRLSPENLNLFPPEADEAEIAESPEADEAAVTGADQAAKETEDMARKSATTAPKGSRSGDRAAQLAALAAKVAVCVRCKELAATRTQTVFGVGNPHARIMFIGEAPGADEDRTGEPFVGRAGQLLNKIIEACGWKREDLYICNILRCRPPGNRNPLPEEAANCREYLDGQIEIVDPDFIVCWGSIAAKNLLGTEESIGKLRQKWFRHGRARVLCTYHPSYLLRNPSAKLPVWEDMKLLMKEVGEA